MLDRFERNWHGWPWVLLISGCLLGALIWIYQVRIDHTRHQRDLMASADALEQNLSEQLKRCDRLLDAAAVWASNAERQDRRSWQAMAKRLNVGLGDWCTDALAWYPRVTAAEREKAQRMLWADHGPDADIRPPGHRELYFPLSLVVPESERSLRFIGIDPWANPKRRADLKRAADQDAVAVTPVQLFSTNEYVLLRYVPVRDAQSRLMGFVGAPLRLERLGQQLHETYPMLRVTLGSFDDEGVLQRVTAPRSKALQADDDLEPVSRRITTGGQFIEVGVEALHVFHGTSGSRWASLLLPSAIVALTLMASLLVRVLQRSDEHARRLAEALSAEALSQRQDALRAEAQRTLLVELVPIGVMHIGPDNHILHANKAAHEMLGYDQGGLHGMHVTRIHDDAELRARCEEITREVGGSVRPAMGLFASQKSADGKFLDSEWLLVRRDGSRFPSVLSSSPMTSHEGQLLGSVRVFTDISERKMAQEQMRFLALHDGLTGLPNRVQLEQVAQLWLNERCQNDLALLLMDLNRFKQINDSLGHPVGDEVLREIGRRLQQAVRPTDFVARMGGDEFVVLLQGVPDVCSVQAAAMRVRAIFDLDVEPASTGTRLRMSGSIGVALHPQHGRDLASLLKAADLAMYRAKRQASSEAVIYDSLQDSPDAMRLLLERDLRVAIADGQFEVHYQPIVEARTSRPVAVEALVRWRHPTFGLIAPSAFIPVAEATGDIVELGAWVLETSCRKIHELRAHWPELQLAVNMSVRQLECSDFDQHVVQILAETGLPAHALELEVTEGLLAASCGRVPAELQTLRRAGVRIAIDDFGTGYSALHYLKNFPISTMKVDRAFVCDITEDRLAPAGGASQDGSLASAVVALGKSMGLHTVAEGVETELQQNALVAAGCDCLQGYRFSPPVPLDQLHLSLLRLKNQSEACNF